MGPGEWRRRTAGARGWLLEKQRELGMVPDDGIHPTDYVPRIVQAADWAVLERGLAQRMRAINEWLRRLEAGKDEVVPREVVESSALFDASIPTRFGDVPNRQMGFDIVAVERSGRRWEYLVIEDNAKMPVGIEPMALLRTMTPDVLPESYKALGVRPLDGLMERLRRGRTGRLSRARPDRSDPLHGSRRPVLPRPQGLRLRTRCDPGRAPRGRVRPRREARPQGERPPDRRHLRAHRERQDLRRCRGPDRSPGQRPGRRRLRPEPRHRR